MEACPAFMQEHTQQELAFLLLYRFRINSLGNLTKLSTLKVLVLEGVYEKKINKFTRP